ncbi:MAG: sugar nucleotide-binding protein, partial [Vicinamibacterales bacterium]|nr:sugar nucleotide-binding protein [Vicinamibacterales bacterium]
THAAADRFASRDLRGIVADLADEQAAASPALRGFDAYVHTAFEASARGAEVDRQAVEALGAAARESGAQAFLYTSGIWVLGPTTGADETAPVNPTPLVAFRPVHEQVVLALGGGPLRAIVVRPGVVYGGGRGIVGDMLRDAENGIMRVIGNGENHWPLVYDRDLADLYARLVAGPEASGIFHATDDTQHTVAEIAAAIAAHPQQKPDIRYMPIAEARAKMGPYADALALDQVVRSPRARALGWQPTLGSIVNNVPRLFEEWRNARTEG